MFFIKPNKRSFSTIFDKLILVVKSPTFMPAELLIQNSDANEDLIKNINSVLSLCTTKQLKKIYEIILLFAKK